MKNIFIYKTLKLNLSIAIIALVIGAIYKLFDNSSLPIELINLGILLIIISPILRILLELIFFIKEKNYTYVSICLILFIIILISIIC
ncbi:MULTISPECIES: DUF1634 domain-containing protein [unclassified Francisella]|uniref:DUF1634 domain-containing protein n=1 Tax=unclassified Francisella TaxID=2610885 RepID=UPI002E346FE8|nr:MULTISPECIES: DUF1634 domain-containing protein [unclassified Francisella]MED7819796.1 DUF1634 domain-containing protein [Francisella sp. 19S2-4]MED7830616.1 DUF1634 domain-containing protein [Francisella sp. 19S2-10]